MNRGNEHEERAGGAPPTVVALADLFFASKVRAVADRLGMRVVVRNRPADLIDTVRSQGAHLVLVDLESRSPGLFSVLADFRSHEDLAAVRLVGFASHLNRMAFEAAREAGVATALTRSAFVQELPALLMSVAGGIARTTRE